jgi:hypothetical protein
MHGINVGEKKIVIVFGGGGGDSWACHTAIYLYQTTYVMTPPTQHK